MSDTPFNKNGYQVVTDAIGADLAALMATEFEMLRTNLFLSNGVSLSNKTFFNDPQVENSFSWYGAYSFESLLLHMLPAVEEVTGKQLYPTYSYARIYWNDATMAIHTDRPSCQYSATITIEEDEDVSWPIYMANYDGEIKPLHLKTGSMCVYRGDRLEHYREAYTGKRQIQAFLHYVDADGEFAEFKYDKRPALGMPAATRRE